MIALIALEPFPTRMAVENVGRWPWFDHVVDGFIKSKELEPSVEDSVCSYLAENLTKERVSDEAIALILRNFLVIHKLKPLHEQDVPAYWVRRWIDSAPACRVQHCAAGIARYSGIPRPQRGMVPPAGAFENVGWDSEGSSQVPARFGSKMLGPAGSGNPRPCITCFQNGFGSVTCTSLET